MSWPTHEVNKLIDAMVVAEGGHDAFVRACRISVPSCADYGDARAIALNTIAHLAWDIATDTLHGFVHGGVNNFVIALGARWAPVGAKNDPHNLNKNWAPNVLAAFKR